jgi:hypothetical protein
MDTQSRSKGQFKDLIDNLKGRKAIDTTRKPKSNSSFCDEDAIPRDFGREARRPERWVREESPMYEREDIAVQKQWTKETPAPLKALLSDDMEARMESWAERVVSAQDTELQGTEGRTGDIPTLKEASIARESRHSTPPSVRHEDRLDFVRKRTNKVPTLPHYPESPQSQPISTQESSIFPISQKSTSPPPYVPESKLAPLQPPQTRATSPEIKENILRQFGDRTGEGFEDFDIVLPDYEVDLPDFQFFHPAIQDSSGVTGIRSNRSPEPSSEVKSPESIRDLSRAKAEPPPTPPKGGFTSLIDTLKSFATTPSIATLAKLKTTFSFDAAASPHPAHLLPNPSPSDPSEPKQRTLSSPPQKSSDVVEPTPRRPRNRGERSEEINEVELYQSILAKLGRQNLRTSENKPFWVTEKKWSDRHQRGWDLARKGEMEESVAKRI